MPIVQDAAAATMRRLVKTLPLPIALPPTLERASGPWTDLELRGRIALLTRLRDDYDRALATELLHQGADLAILDAQAPRAWVDALHKPNDAGATVRHAPAPLGDAAALAEAVARALDGPAAGPTPRRAILAHRVELDPDEKGPAAIERALEGLYAIGHAATRLPGGSRVLIHAAEAEADPRPEAEIAHAAVPGFLRSLAKELGKRGTTAHALESGEVSPERFARAAAFFAGPRASFLTALHLRVDGPESAAPTAPAAPGKGWSRRLLEGKVAVVTGAGRGIGAAIARALAREGAAVGLNDLPSAERAAASTLAALRAEGAHAAFLPFDVSTDEGARAMAQAVKQELGHVDVIVNNAGITRDRTIARMKPEGWAAAVRVNLLAQVRVVDALEPILRDRGRILNLSSVMGIAGNFGQTNYAAAKAGVIGLTRSLAARMRERGVSVNALAPGMIRTRLTEVLPLLNRELARQLTALLQAGEPEDVAELVAFLAGPDGGAFTGQTIRVDGGFAMGA